MSQQKYITKKVQLLSGGRLQESGYCTKMNFLYNRREVRGRLKEWNFYQVLCGDKVLQFTIGHINWCAQISANLIDLSNGNRASFCKTFLASRRIKRALDLNPEEPSQVLYLGKYLKAQFATTQSNRRLTLSNWHKNRLSVEIYVTLTNC